MQITKRLATRAGLALATIAIGAGISAQAAGAATTSAGHSLDVNVPKHGTVTLGLGCEPGTHVDGYWGHDPDSGAPTGVYVPDVKVSGFWVYRTGDPVPTSPYTDGKDGLYRGFTIGLRNYDATSSHTSKVSWVCDAN